MPTTGTPSGTKSNVVREIRFYELTQRDQAEFDGAFFSQVQTKLVKKTTSNEEGVYQIELKPGMYSAFVWEDGRLYANRFDGNGKHQSGGSQKRERSPS